MKNSNDKLALLTVIFDRPNNVIPLYYNNSLKYFNKEDVHIARFNKIYENHEGFEKMELYYNLLFYYKIIKLNDYIKKNILGKYEFMIFLDAFDTNFLRSPENIIQQFKKFNCSILFSGEKHIWPSTKFDSWYQNKNNQTDFCYLNAGGYIGYVDKIVMHLDNITKDDVVRDDQGAWSIEYLKNDDILLDQHNELFFCTQDSKELISVKNQEILIDKYKPIIVHDNGPQEENSIQITLVLNN